MIFAYILILILSGTVILISRQPFIGATPSGKRKERMQQSPQFRQGAFQNSSPTPVQSKEFSIWRLLRNQLSPAPGKEPIIQVLQAAKNVNLRVTTPRIGEPERINQSYPLDRWWEQSI